MSMRPDFQNRDFKKNPLKREDTLYRNNPDEEILVQQNLNEGGRLDTTAIVARAFQTGTLTHTRDHTARYLDATAHTDFAKSLNTKIRADQLWAELPDELRHHFRDDQRSFVEFCLDPNNIEQLREMGLVQALKTPETLKVEVVNPAPPEPPKGSENAPEGA